MIPGYNVSSAVKPEEQEHQGADEREGAEEVYAAYFGCVCLLGWDLKGGSVLYLADLQYKTYLDPHDTNQAS